MGFRKSLGSRSYVFADLRSLMAKASPLRSGDCLSGVAAATSEERIAAALILAEVPLKRFLDEPLIPYE
jgi:ethanolamine ammonia-lyase large subunit